MKGGLSPLRVTLSAQCGTLALSSSLETTMTRVRAHTLSLEKDLSTEKTSRFRVLGLHEERDYTLFRYREL